MQYRDLGKTGIRVSALGFGAMRLPTQENGKVDHPKAIAALHRAFELGVNYVDTAYIYHDGESEVVVGEALKGRTERIYLSTKNHYKGASGEEWMKNLETQLKRLDMDHIDLYLAHGLTWEEYTGGFTAPDGPLDMAHKAIEQGKIGRLSFSSHDTPENVIRLLDTGHFATLTMQYNLLDRKSEPVIVHAREKGVGFIAMGPIGGGRLVPPSETIRAMVPGGAKSTVEVALRFVLANPGVNVAISGMGTIPQVEENVAICSREEPLSDQEKIAVVAALEETHKLEELYCTGCRYCMPCPNEVNIPHLFALMNLHKVYGMTNYAREQYEIYRTVSNPWNPGKTAEACVECGQCEPKCPQKIPIMQQLKEVEKALGGSKK